MNPERVYSPAEICNLFNISKSTLFRWEGEPGFPLVDRDLANNRQYTQEHIQFISTRQKEQLARQYRLAAQSDNEGSVPRMQQIHEALSLRKFLSGDLTGLRELAELSALTPRTIRHLLQIALDQKDLQGEVFCQIIDAIWRQTCRRH